MLVRLAVLLVLLAPATALAAQTTLPDVEDEVMCIQCGTALNISQAPSADQERGFIRELIAQGLTKDQIKDRLVDEYGPKVLAEPRQTTSWIVPLALALLGAAAIATTARRWRRTATLEPALEPELPSADRSRLERDMQGYEL